MKASLEPLTFCGEEPQCTVESSSVITDLSFATTASGSVLSSYATSSNSTTASSGTLRNLVFLEEWENIVSICKSDPQKAETIDKVGDLPLHEACLQGAPLRVIKAIFLAYPAGIRQMGFCNRLPLHYASYNKPSLTMIKFLLEKFPNGALAVDSDGRLPLHLAVIRSAPEECVQALVPPDPESLRRETKYGNTPIMLANTDNVYAILEEEESRSRDGLMENLKKVKTLEPKRDILANKGIRNDKQRQTRSKEVGNSGSLKIIKKNSRKIQIVMPQRDILANEVEKNRNQSHLRKEEVDTEYSPKITKKSLRNLQKSEAKRDKLADKFKINQRQTRTNRERLSINRERLSTNRISHEYAPPQKSESSLQSICCITSSAIEGEQYSTLMNRRRGRGGRGGRRGRTKSAGTRSRYTQNADKST